MKNVTPITLLVLCCTCFTTMAQINELFFDRLSTDQGLSQSFVHALGKDQSGFVWVGTQDGLNRFDGLNFLNYFNDKTSPNSLSNNYIWDLHQDSTGKLWIGTKGTGLCLYEPDLDRFSSFRIDVKSDGMTGQNSVRVIHKLHRDALLLGTDAGLYLFDIKNAQFEKLGVDSSEKDFNAPIFSIKRITDTQLLIGSFEQVYRYDELAGKLSAVRLSTKIQGGIHAITQQGNEELWLGTGNGLFQYQWIAQGDSLNLVHHYLPTSDAGSSITSSYISSLLFDDSGGLWIGTNDGLNYLNTKNIAQGFSHFKNDPANDRSISNNLIFDILEVEEGVLWIGTQDGINQVSLNNTNFKKYDLRDTKVVGCGISAHGMMEASDGNLLICTEKGLTIIDKENPDFQCYDKTNFPEMEDEFLVSISPGKEDQYWVALRRGGFAQFTRNESGDQWDAYKLPAGKYSHIGTNDLLEDKNENLWIASSGLGLWKLNQKTGDFSSFTSKKADSLSISGNYIFHLLEDHSGRLWVSTADGGLCILDRDSESFTRFVHDAANSESISSNMVLSVFEDRQNRIWACTADGLSLYLENGNFRRFYKKDGLPNNVIYGMLEDELGYLWLSTDQGISRVKWEQGQLVTKNYSSENGLLKNEFNQHAFLKLKNGELVFGSKGGVNYFAPSSIKNYEIDPRLVFTDFKIFNKSISVNSNAREGGIKLNQSINSTSKITLPHDHNFIAFEYMGINFEQANANQYAYRLDGLDEDWVYCGERRFASYPGLNPGVYTLRVKAANHDGFWSATERSIQVLIKNPPWKTWWAYLIYILAGFLCIYSIFKYRLYTIRKIEQTKQEERIKFRKKSAQDFHDEAGNQITKISLISEIAKRQSGDNEELKDLLDEVGKNIQNLRSGMRDFIWVLDPDKDNLLETLLRLQDFANEIFEYAPIHYRTIGLEENLSAIVLPGNVRRHLLLIFKEAINNCLQYSKAQNAQLEISRDQGKISLKFWDDGIGFDPVVNKNGYGIRNIKARAQKIAADVQIDSVEGKGTKIQVTIDITQMGD